MNDLGQGENKVSEVSLRDHTLSFSFFPLFLSLSNVRGGESGNNGWNEKREDIRMIG